jgi:uncharacterized integral membrane protein
VDLPTGAPPAPPAAPAERSSAAIRLLRFVARHPARVAQAVFALLVVIVVLQNLEPTSIDVLFWSIQTLPKLVMILAGMLIGGVFWEIARRLIFRR